MVADTLGSLAGADLAPSWAFAPLANVVPPLRALAWWAVGTTAVVGGTAWALHQLGRRRPPIPVAAIPVVLLVLVVAAITGAPAAAAVAGGLGAGVVALGWRREPRAPRRGPRSTTRTGVAVVVLAAGVIGVVAVDRQLATVDEAARVRDDEPRPAPHTVPPADGDDIVVGLADPVLGFDPSWDDLDGDAWTAATLVYDPLAAVGHDGAIRPDLAAGFDHDPDLRTWRIRLRPDVRFRDGTPCDAAAVAANLEDRRTGRRTAAALEGVVAVRVLDPLTVEVATAAPWARFPAALTGPAGLVAAPSTLAPGARTAGAFPVGTGRYQRQPTARPEVVALRRTGPGWRRDARGAPLPGPERIELHTVPAASDRARALDRADVDVLVAPGDRGIWRRAADLDLVGWRSEHGARVAAVAFHLASGPFADPRLREAAELAIDRTALVGTPTQDTATFEPHAPIAALPDGGGSPRPVPAPDPARAAVLRTAAAGEGPTPVVLAVGPGEDDAELGQAVADAWRAVGFAVTLEVVDDIAPPAPGTPVAVTSADATLVHIATGPDLDDLRPWLLSSGDPALREALDRARATDDQATRTEAWHQVRDLAVELRPVLWLTRRPLALAAHRELGIGPTGTPLDGRAHPARAIGPDGDDLDPLGTGRADLGQVWVHR